LDGGRSRGRPDHVHCREMTATQLDSERGPTVAGAFLMGFFDAHTQQSGIPADITDEALPHYVAAQRGQSPADASVLKTCEALVTIAEQDLEPLAHEAGWSAAMDVIESGTTSTATFALASFLREHAKALAP